MKNKLSTLQVQRTVLAPIMQKSIAVLLLPLTELNTTIEQELQNNPLLEIDEDAQSQTLLKNDDEPSYSFKSLVEATDGPAGDNTIDDGERGERSLTKPESIEDFLMRQLRLAVSDSLSLRIGEEIIGNINEDGFLLTSLEDIGQKLGLSDAQRIESVLKIIQGFEPFGIAARDLKECLLAQLQASSYHDKKSAEDIILRHLENLSKKKYKEMAKTLNISLEEVQAIAHFISTLEPRPARNYQAVDNSIYVKPDIFVRSENSEFQVIVNNHDIPPLRISPTYRELLSRNNLSQEEKAFIEERIQSAFYFIKCIRQREETLSAIMKYIVQKQKEFFKEGYCALTPMTLKDVAGYVGRDESTVSRAIRSKYVDTVYGIYPLKFFFSTAISTESNGDMASRSIIEEIRDMINEEDKKTPLSDQDIQQRFKERGINIARRTVAKYRKDLKISSSYLRKG